MNKTDRLLAIVLELQSKKLQTAEQLSEIFEVSKRTIYRDIISLCESGVPIISKQGLGYSLTDNYFLPPISFTPDEITIILLGLDFIKNTFDLEYSKKSLNVENKLNIVLSEKQKLEAKKIKEKFTLLSQTLNEDNKINNILKEIRTAILNSNKLYFTYFTKNLDKNISNRTVCPYKLVYISNNWYLSAFCLDKNEMRTFKINRMENIKILNSYFDLNIFENRKIYIDNRNKNSYIIVSKKIERLIKEESFYYIDSLESEEDYLKINLRYRTNDEIVPWILSLGSNLKSVYPEELKEIIKKEAEKVLDIY